MKQQSSYFPRRSLLPMSTGIRILPQQSLQIIARSQLPAFCPDRLLIENGGHWNIDDGIQPGDNAEGAVSLGTGFRSGAAFSPAEWWPLPARVVSYGDKIVLGVTYVGPHAEGESFEAALFGWDGTPPQMDNPHGRGSRVTERARSSEVPFNETVRLPLCIGAPSLFADRLTIADPENWVVQDIVVRGKSVLVQGGGELPGEMFSAGDTVILGSLAAKDLIEVVASYVGGAPSARLTIELSGTTKPSREPCVGTLFLPMSTGVPILPDTSAQITGRPQEVPQGFAFLPERVVIRNARNWSINDIKVGVFSQFAQSGDVPGVAFSSRGVGCHVRFAPVRPKQDFVIVVTNLDCEVGEPFVCGVQGSLVKLTE